jgi:NADPH:quinone reductase-like Zn-dependent oxidoreductase
MSNPIREVLYTTIHGDPSETVEVREQAAPTCPEDGVVVAVRARPINPADLLLLEGRHVFTPELPAHVGIEGAGEVVEVGARSRLAVGARVALPSGGTWRDRMAFRDDDVLALPADVDLEQAAMLCVNPFTAMGLLESATPGGTVLVNAATSAIGRLVLAIARRRGLATIAVVRELRGAPPDADVVLVDGDDLAARAKASSPSPITLALDAVAGSASGRLFDALAEGGTLIVYGLLASDRVDLPASGVVFRDVNVRGFSRLRGFRAMTAERRAAITTELVQMLADGTLTTEIEARYALTDVKAALAHHLRPGRKGKILLLTFHPENRSKGIDTAIPA